MFVKVTRDERFVPGVTGKNGVVNRVRPEPVVGVGWGLGVDGE